MTNDYFKYIKAFVDNDDIARNNANFVRSVMTMENVVISAVMRDYLFKEIYSGLPIEILHNEGWIYHHQTGKISPYCIGLSAKSIAMLGLNSNAKNERQAKPPKRLETLFMQCANLICLISQEVSGATSLNDISTVAAGYLKVLEDKGITYTDYQLKNIWQEFLYNVNLPFRAGNSPFSNITLEFGKPNPILAEEPVVYCGQLLNYPYKEIEPVYFNRINDAFIEAMKEGDAKRNPFTFPLITINLYDDFDFENKSWKKLLKESDRFGGFYVQNYQTRPFLVDSKYKKFNPYIQPFDQKMIYSNCCRMLFDVDLVETVMGTNPFASGSGVGGIGVFAINMNRILYVAKNRKRDAKKMIRYLLEQGQRALQRKRKWIKERWNDLYPYLSFYQKTDKSLYNIFSVVGVHEGLINAGFKGGLTNEKGKEYAHELAQFILDVLQEFMKRDGVLCSLEYAPSENAACRLAEKDLLFAKEPKTNDEFLAEFVNKL